ncbi:probable transcription factor KAN4 isoform X1 [Coffea eugenioides]|uniref:probable transcription factor KAN4 isoform X1 n=1 Tax=Coffea eugenioides TaxID=49369 RepID=UPI000F5C592F|nr:probable transcription factor KAN4 isoform X1 [Coffea arabica]XP_027149252.1 probable transcription factor KAN4 isoform X1 [Coffea eugenioides]
MAAKGNDTKILHTSDRQLQVAENTRKPRIRWTPGLHNCFIKAVDRLGGPFEATPKEIMTQMDIPEVTSSHIKSHLQKYRLRMGCNSGTAADSTVARKAATNTMFEADDGSNTAGWHTNDIRYIQVQDFQSTNSYLKKFVLLTPEASNLCKHKGLNLKGREKFARRRIQTMWGNIKCNVMGTKTSIQAPDIKGEKGKREQKMKMFSIWKDKMGRRSKVIIISNVHYST